MSVDDKAMFHRWLRLDLASPGPRSCSELQAMVENHRGLGLILGLVIKGLWDAFPFRENFVKDKIFAR